MKFLNHPFYPQHRVLIFKYFPELEILLKNKKENQEKATLRQFIKKFYKKHNKKIQEIIKFSKKILKEKSKKSLKELAKSMDYQWSKNHPNYTAMPTILPFSPFNNNIFYFSILKKRESNNILFIAIHEISHMVLFEILKNQYKKPLRQIMNETTLYFLKEILAPIIMNQKSLKKMLNTKNYLGNSLLHNLFITIDEKKQKEQITKFFQQFYEISKYKKQKKFNQMLNEMIKIILSIEKKLEIKKKIWDKYGNKIIDNPNILKQYNKAIKIKKG